MVVTKKNRKSLREIVFSWQYLDMATVGSPEELDAVFGGRMSMFIYSHIGDGILCSKVRKLVIRVYPVTDSMVGRRPVLLDGVFLFPVKLSPDGFFRRSQLVLIFIFMLFVMRLPQCRDC